MKDDEQASGLERTQVNLRLEQRVIDEIDELARRTDADRTEVVRRLLRDGLGQERVRYALDEYATGKATAWQAASIARISLYEMLDRIRDTGVPHELDEDVITRLRAPDAPPKTGDMRVRRRLERAPRDQESGIADLRERYRPTTVRVLFVGEASPAGGTHFYRANSNLFRAMREAFAEAFQGMSIPTGGAFLEWFSGLGCWLVDLADRPVDRLSGDARKGAVEAGIDALAITIGSTRPNRIVAVKRDVAPKVRRAAKKAGFDESAIDVAPFPLYQWRRPFVEQVAALLRDEIVAGSDETVPSMPKAARAEAVETSGTYVATLHDAIENVLDAAGGGPMSYQAIAREIARVDLWRRPADGHHPPAGQISARVNKHPGRFQKTGRGVRLRRRREGKGAIDSSG